MVGSLPAWRARRIARTTSALSFQAAAYVDAQIHRFAHRVGPAEIDRLVADATARFMPQTAAAARLDAEERRHVTIGTDTVSFHGTTWITGELDLADALDLDTALATGAASLSAAGSDQSLDVRRAVALGELARHQTTLDLNPLVPTEQTGPDSGSGTGTQAERSAQTRRPVKPRQVVLHVHLSQAALTGRNLSARVETRGRHLVTTDQVRDWCANPDAQITITPVVDLTNHVHVAQYEIPDRLADQTEHRDLTYVFPWCERPAARCDKDHARPYAHGGPTATNNLACLCRHHHRLKTFAGWTYTILEPGTYLWRSPHGEHYLRDHTGTDVATRDPSRGHPPDH